MKPILTSKEMKTCDAYAAAQNGNTSQSLMEAAALAAMNALTRHFSPAHVRVVAGIGNNGGDGFALARFLRAAGHSVDVCAVGDSRRMSVECGRQALLYAMDDGVTVPAVDAPLPNETEEPDSDPFDGDGLRLILVDALFGIGLDRPIEGEFAEALRAINRLRGTHADTVRVMALDLPSGIADDGRLLGPANRDGFAVRADLTVTFGYIKRGMMLYPARKYLGQLEVADIGITVEGLETSPAAYAVDEDDVRVVMSRPAWSHKGTFGRVVLFAGSRGMCGAAILAARGAYRAGAGLVEIVSDEVNLSILQTAIPEAIVTPYCADQLQQVGASALFDGAIRRASAIVIGCGMGQSDCARAVMEYVLTAAQAQKIPTVIDADGLNLLAAHSGLWSRVPSAAVLTPHVGEMARLCGCGVQEVTSDLCAAASRLSEAYGVTCLLKDAASIVCGSGRVYYPLCGNSGMATAGSGDVLAGILGAVLAYRGDLRFEEEIGHLAAISSSIHAMAGRVAASRLGEHGVMASDIADCIGIAIG